MIARDMLAAQYWLAVNGVRQSLRQCSVLSKKDAEFNIID